jgi:hypothetical protein
MGRRFYPSDLTQGRHLDCGQFFAGDQSAGRPRLLITNLSRFCSASDLSRFSRFLLRYVERNPLSAGLVSKSQDWRWGGLWSRTNGQEAMKALLSRWSVERPPNWTARVNTPLTAKELDRVRLSMTRGRPYGGDEWLRQTVERLGLQHTVQSEGRPRKTSQSATDTTPRLGDRPSRARFISPVPVSSHIANKTGVGFRPSEIIEPRQRYDFI